MPNPYALLASVVAAAAVTIGAFFFGLNVGADREVAKQAREGVLIEKVSTAAQEAAAREIAKIRVTNTTQKQVLEREIINVPDYSLCRHSPDGMRAVNSALENRAEPAGDRGLPRADTVER